MGLRLHCHPLDIKLDPLVLHSVDVAWMWAASVWVRQSGPMVFEVTLAAAIRRAAQSAHP